MFSLHNLQVEIYIFFKAIYRMWVACGQYSELDPLDVKDELFDLVKPRDPLRITLQDLVVSALILAVVPKQRNSVSGLQQCGKSVSSAARQQAGGPAKSPAGDWLLCWCIRLACSIFQRRGSMVEGALKCSTTDVGQKCLNQSAAGL